MLTQWQRDTWVAALRSGEYHKGEYFLAQRHPKGMYDYKWEFCAIGAYLAEAGVDLDLMTNVADPEDVLDGWDPTPSELLEALADYSFQFRIPKESWAKRPDDGLGRDPGHITLHGWEGITTMNDFLDYSFARLANIIEHLPVRKDDV